MKACLALFWLHLSEVVVKSLEGVANEWQAHFRRLLCLGVAVLLDGLSLEYSGIVRLVNFVRREVRCVNIGRQSRLEWRSDAPQAVKVNTTEEGVALELMSAASAKSILRVAHHAVTNKLAMPSDRTMRMSYLRIRFSASTPSLISSGK